MVHVLHHIPELQCEGCAFLRHGHVQLIIVLWHVCLVHIPTIPCLLTTLQGDWSGLDVNQQNMAMYGSVCVLGYPFHLCFKVNPK